MMSDRILLERTKECLLRYLFDHFHCPKCNHAFMLREGPMYFDTLEILDGMKRALKESSQFGGGRITLSEQLELTKSLAMVESLEAMGYSDSDIYKDAVKRIKELREKERV